MKNIGIYTLIAVFTLCGLGCDKFSESHKVTSATAPWIDVTVNEQRYYGIALTREVVQGEASDTEFSCVILSPWDDRPGTTIGVEGDISTITLPSGEFKIVGRRVCTTNATGDTITVYPSEIPIEAFDSREKLQEATAQIMKKPNKTQMATPKKLSD